MILTGLFSAWVKNDTVVKYLGHASGTGGFALAFSRDDPHRSAVRCFSRCCLPVKKGARTANIIIFLSSWACIKLPQELVEMRFMGIKFMILRLFLTVVLVFIMGLIIEKFTVHPNEKEDQADA